MTDAVTKGEIHGCIVCGKLYHLYTVYDSQGKYMGARVMSGGGRIVEGTNRPLVACESHSDVEVAIAVERVYGQTRTEEE